MITGTNYSLDKAQDPLQQILRMGTGHEVKEFSALYYDEKALCMKENQGFSGNRDGVDPGSSRVKIVENLNGNVWIASHNSIAEETPHMSIFSWTASVQDEGEAPYFTRVDNRDALTEFLGNLGYTPETIAHLEDKPAVEAEGGAAA